MAKNISSANYLVNLYFQNKVLVMHGLQCPGCGILHLI